MRPLILLAASLVVPSGCAKTDPPTDPPIGVTATPGDGVVLMSWDQLPDLTYWIFYRANSTSVAPGDVGSIAIKDAVSPRAVTGLLNGTQYALSMNASLKDSAAGPNSPSLLATPRLAGDIWTPGSTQGTQSLNALANTGTRFVTVGDGATIFAGDFNYGHTDPVGVTQWFGPSTTPPITWFPPNLPPTTVPPFTAGTDFKAVINNGSFIALASNGSVATSGDGLNWLPQHQVASGVTGLTGLAFGGIQGNLTYLAVGSGGQMYTTTDITQPWTLSTALNTTNDLTSIAVLNGFFIVTGSNSTLLVSPDGLNWTLQQVTGLPPGTTLRAVTFMPNAPALVPGPPFPIAYAVVGDGGVIVTATQITRDANNIPSGDWAAIALPGAQNLRSVTVGGATGTRFLAIGQGGAVVFGDSVISDVTTGIPTPVNPIQWSVASQPPTGDFSSVFFFTGQYLAVGAAGANTVCH